MSWLSLPRGFIQLVLQETVKSETNEESQALQHSCYWSAGMIDLVLYGIHMLSRERSRKIAQLLGLGDGCPCVQGCFLLGIPTVCTAVSGGAFPHLCPQSSNERGYPCKITSRVALASVLCGLYGSRGDNLEEKIRCLSVVFECVCV